MRRIAISLAFTALATAIASALPVRAADKAGEFDYYVLALSWNAAWCEGEGAGNFAPQCDPSRDIGFILHGLWPQRERGWPEFCRTSERDPSRSETRAMADIMGSGGLAWHQWKKHGRCSGLSSDEYFALARAAWQEVTRPDVFRKVRTPMRVPPGVIEEAFLEANPKLRANGVTVTCKDSRFQEIRICLTKGLVPRACTGSVARDCEMSNPVFVPMR